MNLVGEAALVAVSFDRYGVGRDNRNSSPSHLIGNDGEALQYRTAFLCESFAIRGYLAKTINRPDADTGDVISPSIKKRTNDPVTVIFLFRLTLMRA